MLVLKVKGKEKQILEPAVNQYKELPDKIKNTPPEFQNQRTRTSSSKRSRPPATVNRFLNEERFLDHTVLSFRNLSAGCSNRNKNPSVSKRFPQQPQDELLTNFWKLNRLAGTCLGCSRAGTYRLTLDLWLAKDNRFLISKSSYQRILTAPQCRLIGS